ncbi:pumilio homolog 24 [Ipomoea triloba]|uniref:pumilio homolog 24 n=1 Tax=Ipomoea triloba TaxID=35885 RepID=UPI00125E6EBC|nr:pumilio homolog 24 [Ipomoea triloba]
MAAKGEQSKKRKHVSHPKGDATKSNPKKLKSASGNPKDGPKKPFISSKQGAKLKQKEAKPRAQTDNAESKRESRLRAKELTEARKKKRKRHYTLEQELTKLWEKMRQRNISKEDRSRLVTEALNKMQGKIPEVASSHVSSRVLQTCVKHCTVEERNAVFQELRPNFITLACNTYSVHLVTKMLDNASKEQLAKFISSLHGHVASLLRQMVGSLVIEHAYQLGNSAQKQALLMELYSSEIQMFKDLLSVKETRVVDVISKLQLQKSSVLRHMTAVLQPILEKGILDHSIIHKALMEFLSITDQSSAADVIQQLSSADLVRMMHTKDGSRIAMLCIKHGSAKDRKKIIKGMKGKIEKIAHDKYGCMVLVCILSTVDDTKLLSKIIIRELEGILKEIVLDQNARRPLLQLLHPLCSRYFSPDDLDSMNLSIPSLLRGPSEVDEAEPLGVDEEDEIDAGVANSDKTKSPPKVQHLNEGGKKDPLRRRQELLVDSGLAEKLINVCLEMTGELLRSNFGKDVIFEVASGGADGILHPTLDEKLGALHGAIASLASQPKLEESEEEHLLEQYHSSRTIRKLVLECPAFACKLYENALKGKCATWVQGHSSKVVSALWETSDPAVRELIKEEMQPLVDNGVLKVAQEKETTKAGRKQ